MKPKSSGVGNRFGLTCEEHSDYCSGEEQLISLMQQTTVNNPRIFIWRWPWVLTLTKYDFPVRKLAPFVIDIEASHYIIRRACLRQMSGPAAGECLPLQSGPTSWTSFMTTNMANDKHLEICFLLRLELRLLGLGLKK